MSWNKPPRHRGKNPKSEEENQGYPQFDDDDDDDEMLSARDAALIWASNGMDEDYTFGYDEDELRKYL